MPQPTIILDTETSIHDMIAAIQRILLRSFVEHGKLLLTIELLMSRIRIDKENDTVTVNMHSIMMLDDAYRESKRILEQVRETSLRNSMLDLQPDKQH